MGFINKSVNINGREVKMPKPRPAPEPEQSEYEPDFEPPVDPEDIPDLDFPTEPEIPEDEPLPFPKSSNPFGNNPLFDEPDVPEREEVIMPDEKLQGFNDEDREKMKQAEKDLEDKKREENILTDNREDGEKISENSEIKKDLEDEEIRKAEKAVFDGAEFVILETSEDKAKDNDDKSCDTKEAREPYSLDAMATVPKITFAKPKQEVGGIKKILIFLCACIAVGIFLGIKANSYWVNSGMTESGLSSCFMWLMRDDVKTTLSPFSIQIFGTGVAVGAGLLGIIGLFVYLESDQKKRSRVGHEHGTGHIAQKKDFTVYKNKFMEE